MCPYGRKGCRLELKDSLHVVTRKGKSWKRRYTYRNWVGHQVGEFRITGCAGLRNGHWRWIGTCAEGHSKMFRAQDIPTTKGVCVVCRSERVKQQEHLRFVWDWMRTRCLNSRATAYSNYGGRGISVCQRWSKFQNFWDDMHATYRPGLTIDRIDNSGNYEPTNCRWATRVEQAANTRKPRLKAYFQALADEEGVGLRAIYTRYYRGQPLSPTESRNVA